MTRMQTLVLAIVLALAVAVPAMAEVLYQNAQGITQADLYVGETGEYTRTYGSFQDTFTAFLGVDYQLVDVALRGWKLRYKDGDHHLSSVEFSIHDANYNASTGYVTFKVRGKLADKNEDDDYTWKLWYTIFALR